MANKMKTLNEWFLGLEKPHQQLLLEDKWALAEAAFGAATKLKQTEMQAALDEQQNLINELQTQLAAAKAQ